MTLRRPIIAVIGDAVLPEGDPKIMLAEQVGRLVVDDRWRLLTGGLGGVMEVASRGGRSSPHHEPGDILGILPGTDPDEANAFVDVAIPTGLDHVRNILVAQSDAVIAIGGGAGTMAELAFAWLMKRLIVSFRVPGWSGRVADTKLDDRARYKEMPDDKVYGVDTPDEALRLVRDLLPKYRARHHGVRRR